MVTIVLIGPEVGLIEIEVAAHSPVPPTQKVYVPSSESLLTIVTISCKLPVVLGANSISKETVSPAVIVIGSVSEFKRLKSAPDVKFIELTIKSALPSLWIKYSFGAVVSPIIVVANKVLLPVFGGFVVQLFEEIEAPVERSISISGSKTKLPQ